MTNTLKKNVVIFGAGGGGRTLTDKMKDYDEHLEIIAYLDNDTKLQNTELFGKPVHHPSKITSLDFDQIIVASIDSYHISKQLIEYGVPVECIDIKKFPLYVGITARVAALKNASTMLHDMNVKGSVAELGVFQGDFAKYINIAFPSQKLYLFDTFEGFPNADVDTEVELGTDRILKRSYNYSGTSIELVLGKMKYPENCVVKKGYFPETAIGLEDTFSFVSLDADLYKPMFEGLVYFYPRLEKGGIIFIHDYFSDDFTGTKHAVLEYKKMHNICYVPLGDNSSVVIIKP